MSDNVTFAIGGRPTLTNQEAIDLAEFLMRQRNYPAFSLGVRIHRQAAPAPGTESNSAMELDKRDLEQLASILDETAVLTMVPAFAALQGEVQAALRDV
jgi:hypothetical protein